MFVITYRKIFYTISALLIGFSIFAVSFWGLNFGIDFTGGSIMEVAFKESVDIRPTLANLGHGQAIVRQTEGNSYMIRTHSMSEDERRALESGVLSQGGEVLRLDSVGPILGEELQGKAIWSIVLVVLAILIFITYVFRHVSQPVSSWKYGFVAIAALAHDVIVPTGVFAFLGRNGGFEIDTLFVTALLVILGFSIHDTIVVFDRTREHLKNGELKQKSFAHVVGEAISETFSRSINTSLTTMLALVVLWVLGPDATKNFALVMIIGIAVGTYSSIFIGSPLLVTLEKLQANRVLKQKSSRAK
jgi:preprotein translocase subunit SecF